MSAAKKTQSAQHTPGPWKFEKREGGATHEITFGKSKMRPGCIVGWVSKFQAANVEANGPLVAAAPDLLDALVELRQCLNAIAAPGEFSEDLERARAAIAKARGES